jgi:hypothetical protein
MLLSAPVRIINAPIRAVETLCNGGERPHDSDRVLSRPLDALADELKDVDEE